MKKFKLINDPLYGFITIHDGTILKLIDHPFFQRLTRIKQLGLTPMVYPGAQHTRFLHSIGAMYLMDHALTHLRNKDCPISDDEFIAAKIAILLHDIGHGPFSHALEHVLIENVSHEEVSASLINYLNQNDFQGQLSMAIELLNNKYEKKFLHQLISGQVDVDRLDYLRRDSFFTGVREGNIGSERILEMFDLFEGNLVVDEKGIYSIENFLIARRFMYWQVYLHKTVVASECMLIQLMRRARFLVRNGSPITMTPSIRFFMENEVTIEQLNNNDRSVLQHFIDIDDNDIWSLMKVWAGEKDRVLALLSDALLNRNLFKLHFGTESENKERFEDFKKKCLIKGFSVEEIDFLSISNVISSKTYSKEDEKINIYSKKTKKVRDISEVSDMLDIKLLTKNTDKHFFCHLKI